MEKERSIFYEIYLLTHTLPLITTTGLFLTQAGDLFTEIRSYKLDTDDIPDDEVIRSLSR